MNVDFSFGVILWELLHLKQAWSDSTNMLAVSVQVANGKRLQISEEFRNVSKYAHYVKIIESCFQTNPDDRMEFGEILEVFAKAQEG